MGTNLEVGAHFGSSVRKTALKTLVISAAVTIAISFASGQTKVQRMGRVQDWSSRHVAFTNVYTPATAAAVQSDPRIVTAWIDRARRNYALMNSGKGRAFAQTDPGDLLGDTRGIPGRKPRPKAGATIDWNVSLGAGSVPLNMFPAKYSFDINATPSCTDDFVVFGLNVAGVTGGQANLVALNYLYSGTTPAAGICNSKATPTNGSSAAVMWAYNVGTGKVLTSPTLSLDGKEVAFVESRTSSSVFDVLNWARNPNNGSSATAAVAPGTGNTASMTSLTFDAAATNTLSSPFIDYTNDVAYVGSDSGKLYKITGVFNGTPTLAGAPWPVTVTAGSKLTSPVLDIVTGRIFVGDGNGAVKSINAATGAILATLQVGTAGQVGAAIVDPPIVDSSNSLVYAFTANDSTGAAVVQANTSLTLIKRVRIGRGSVGASAANVVSLHSGAFTDAYFTSPASGSLVVCGTDTNDTTPAIYLFDFTGTTINTTARISDYLFLGTNRPGTECSPLTVFLNPNVTAESLYFGVPKNCGGGGCVLAYQLPGLVGTVPESGGTSGIVVDNVSTSAQAASIYFSTLGPTHNAVKLTQAALQ
jgi:hypothetical protein